MRLDVSIKGAPGFSVLPSDYLVACARLSVSADKRTNHARNEIKKREKNGRKRDGESPSQSNFLNPPTSSKTVSRVKMSKLMSKRQKVRCKVSTARITLLVC